MSEPLHDQIAKTLRRTLETGQWRKGQRLPTERALASDLGCAVGTLRKALAVIEQEGLLERVQGRGTFVAQVPKGAEYPLFHLELLAGGGRPSAAVIARGTQPCPVSLTSPQHIRRIRKLDGQAVALEDIWIRLAHPLADDEGDNALYQTLAARHGLWIRRAEDRVGVAQATDLPIEMPETQGFIERYSYDAHGAWVEYSQTFFNHQIARYNARWEQ
ncbi:MAG: GntR family transcriptional regulator [Litorivicinus sp.]